MRNVCRSNSLGHINNHSSPWNNACVFWFSQTSTDTTFFPRHWVFFSYATYVRGKKWADRKFCSTRHQIRSQEVTSHTLITNYKHGQAQTFQVITPSLQHSIFLCTINPFPHKNTFWRPWETSLLKKLWEKEKLLDTSNFSFSHTVFYPFG